MNASLTLIVGLAIFSACGFTERAASRQIRAYLDEAEGPHLTIEQPLIFPIYTERHALSDSLRLPAYSDTVMMDRARAEGQAEIKRTQARVRNAEQMVQAGFFREVSPAVSRKENTTIRRFVLTEKGLDHLMRYIAVKGYRDYQRVMISNLGTQDRLNDRMGMIGGLMGTFFGGGAAGSTPDLTAMGQQMEERLLNDALDEKGIFPDTPDEALMTVFMDAGTLSHVKVTSIIEKSPTIRVAVFDVYIDTTPVGAAWGWDVIDTCEATFLKTSDGWTLSPDPSLEGLRAVFTAREGGEWPATILTPPDAGTPPLGSPAGVLSQPRPRGDLFAPGEEPPAETGGIGVVLKPDGQGRIGVEQVIPGGPADEAGLLAGDVIVAVNAWDAKGQPLEALVERVRGPAGSGVTLKVERQGETYSATLTRRAMNLSQPPE